MSSPTVIRGLRANHARAYIDLVDAIEAHERASLWVDRAAGRYESLSRKLSEHLSMKTFVREPITIALDLVPDTNTEPQDICAN